MRSTEQKLWQHVFNCNRRLFANCLGYSASVHTNRHTHMHTHTHTHDLLIKTVVEKCSDGTYGLINYTFNKSMNTYRQIHIIIHSELPII